MIYLDNHATTQVAGEVLRAMWPYFETEYGNAASINHAFGWRAAEAVQTARGQVGQLLNCPAEWVVFTSGATEANNLAIKGVFAAATRHWANARDGNAKVRPHFITTVAEHPSVLDVARRLKRNGVEVTMLPVDERGRVDPQKIAEAIRSETILVSTMLANNEVGTINPLSEIVDICRKRGVLLHCDAVQAIGKYAVDLAQCPIDLLTLSAHKFHGPKGIGALVVRRGDHRIPLEPLFDGGGHEQHLRSGTVAVPLVVGMGAACELAADWETSSAQMAAQRDRLWRRLEAELTGLTLNGSALESRSDRLPNNLNFSVTGVDGEALMTALKQIAVSSGSACSTTDPEPSHVLRAIGVSDLLSRASLRFGLSRFTTNTEIEIAVSEVVDVVTRLRNGSRKT